MVFYVVRNDRTVISIENVRDDVASEIMPRGRYVRIKQPHFSILQKRYSLFPAHRETSCYHTTRSMVSMIPCDIFLRLFSQFKRLILITVYSFCQINSPVFLKEYNSLPKYSGEKAGPSPWRRKNRTIAPPLELLMTIFSQGHCKDNDLYLLYHVNLLIRYKQTT
jgi:hypothetical protein